ncbi:hypothetical protein F5883DRAFT_656934 [Diaporthe sp. PMI_573]|nr:hypothetical protein F5883DRAFT_656934 [Diaporthaceae sp. PMI_573]
MKTEAPITLTAGILIIGGAVDLAAEVLAEDAAASVANTDFEAEAEAMTIACAEEVIPAELTLGIEDSVMDMAAATTHVNSLESAISVTRKAAGLQSILQRNGDVPETALLYTRSSIGIKDEEDA